MILTRVAPHDHHALVLHVLGPQLEPERDALELPVVVLPARSVVQAAVGHHLRGGRREREGDLQVKSKSARYSSRTSDMRRCAYCNVSVEDMGDIKGRNGLDVKFPLRAQHTKHTPPWCTTYLDSLGLELLLKRIDLYAHLSDDLGSRLAIGDGDEYNLRERDSTTVTL